MHDPVFWCFLWQKDERIYMRNMEKQRISELDYWIEIVVLLLMATGTVFVYSAGATVQGQLDLSKFFNYTTLKQLFFFPLAVGLMLAVSRWLDYRRFRLPSGVIQRSLTPYLLLLSLFLLILVLWIGEERNYSKRWLDLAPGPMYVSFQPSELAKWVILIFLAAYINLNRETLNRFWSRFLPVCGVVGIIVFLIVLEDFGTAAFITLLTFVMLWIGGAIWWHFLTPLPVLIPGFVAAVMTSPTRMNRIKDFLNPEVISYQASQSLKAISTGGAFGRGLGKGIFKYGHLPEDTTDFIFAIIAEEWGFCGAVWVLLLFVAFTVLGILVVLRCRDLFGRLLACGIVLAVSLQAAINIGVVTVVLPTKGIPLPFISAGGTSLLLTAMATGILLNIARQTAITGNVENRSVENLDGQ